MISCNGFLFVYLTVAVCDYGFTLFSVFQSGWNNSEVGLMPVGMS